ncbi:hypothetical protein BH09BAC2_BH09BAC2_10840 [soil metagenome]
MINYMLINKPSFPVLLLKICRAISYFFAGMHNLMIKIGFVNPPVYCFKIQQKRYRTLHRIWYAKLVRRIFSFLIRTPLRRNILKLINFNVALPGDKGCIILTCHSPWKRLLAQWCLEQKFGLLIGGGKWTDQRRIIQRQGSGVIELRELVKYLQSGGRVIIKAEVFNALNDCPVTFLGKNYNASLFAERLAILTKVPIHTIIAKLSDTTFNFTAGPQFSTVGLKSGSTTMTAEIISFFEKEIEMNPEILSIYVK